MALRNIIISKKQLVLVLIKSCVILHHPVTLLWCIVGRRQWFGKYCYEALSLPSKVEARRANGQKAQTDGRARALAAGESTKDERDQEIEEGREADDFPASSVIG